MRRRDHFVARAYLALLSAAAGCGGRDAHDVVTLAFNADAPLGGEAYVCFGFDAGAARAGGVSAIEWRHPGGPVALHHGKLYATATPYPAGPVACDEQPPGAVPLHVWAPGAGSLTMPENVAVTLPPEAVGFVVEAHVVRLLAGDAPAGSVRLTLASSGATVRAGWTARGGTVPALRPGYLEMSANRCTFTAPLHVFFAWAHEHLLGHSFLATVTNGAGSVTLIDVPTWDFTAQAPAAVAVDIAAGDVLDMTCTWLNTTDHYVFPGPKTTDEMCGLGLIASPPQGSVLPCAAN